MKIRTLNPNGTTVMPHSRSLRPFSIAHHIKQLLCTSAHYIVTSPKISYSRLQFDGSFLKKRGLESSLDFRGRVGWRL